MTLVAEPPAQVRQPAPAAPPPPPPAPPSERARVILGVVVAVSTLLVLVLGFFAFLIGFSGLSEARAQHSLRLTLQKQLRNAVAPTGVTSKGPIPEGRPVAVLDIPAIGLHDAIVVEGTSSRDLMNGPGHLPATPLPGQAGTSTIFGKRMTFGAPFAHLLSLKIGDVITTTTALGRSRFVVSSFGTTKHPAPSNAANRLVLLTAQESVSPGGVVEVSADLKSTVQPSPGVLPPIGNQDKPLARDWASSLVPLTGWSQVLLLVAIAAAFLVTRRDVRWPAVLCLLPVALAVLWCVYENAAGLLPNVL